ncbi:Monooxygenase FAD-binding [Penicillium expansum]|nr:Monooxygenase FAD-binding [Penicillium expansum]
MHDTPNKRKTSSLDASADVSQKLQVAVVGGGIAGLSVAISLLQHPGVNVQIYERTKVFREIGASISLGPNGLRTLEKLGVENALDGSVCSRQISDYPMIYRHWRTGEVMARDIHKTVKTKKHFTARFHRAHLHQALLEHVPSQIVHMGKKTIRILADREEGVTLTFEDHTTAKADICIGADGIHSNVRKIFVPDHTLRRTGWTAMRSVFDASLVKDINFPEDASHWIGPDRSFFHSNIGKGMFTVVGGLHTDPSDPSDKTEWDDEYNLDTFRELYKDWHPAVRSLIKATPYTRLYPNMAGRPLDTWTFSQRPTHMGGAFAAGGSLAIDDAYALFLALNHVWPAAVAKSRKPTIEQLAEVFRLYEATRKPHIDKILGAVHLQVIGQKPKTENLEGGNTETDEMLEERVRNRPDPSWISEHDVESAFQMALGAADLGLIKIPSKLA